MTLLKKEVNREIDQDQEDIQDRGTIKVLEKREKISIETRMNIKPEANRGVWDEKHLKKETRITKEEVRVRKIEINLIKKDIKRRKSTTHIPSWTSIRQRIYKIGIEHINRIIEIEEKTGTMIQMMIGQNVHRCIKTYLEIIAIKS